MAAPLREFRWAACLVLSALLMAGSAEARTGAARPSAGQPDHRTPSVAVDPGAPAGVRVVRSPAATVVIRSGLRLVPAIVVGLDGDRRPEIIAVDRARQLHVWTIAGHGLTTPYRPASGPRRRPPVRPPSSAEEGADDRDTPLPDGHRHVPMQRIAARMPRLPAVNRPLGTATTDRVRLPAFVPPPAPRPPPPAAA